MSIWEAILSAILLFIIMTVVAFCMLIVHFVDEYINGDEE